MIETSLHSKYNVQEGLDFLSSKDEKIANLIILNPNFSLSKRCSGFKALLKTIISQQLSTSAANSIWSRFVKNDLISRHKILEADQEVLLSLDIFSEQRPLIGITLPIIISPSETGILTLTKPLLSNLS